MAQKINAPIQTRSARIIDAGDTEALTREVRRLYGVSDKIQRDWQKQAGAKATTQINRKVSGVMLRSLRKYPPRKLGMRIRWKSAKQRRYVMMLLRKNGDIPYRRKGIYKRGWKYKLTMDDKGSITLKVTNDAQQPDLNGKPNFYARYVGGDIGFGQGASSASRYMKPKQPFHKDRGWPDSYRIIQRAHVKMQNIVMLVYTEALVDIAEAD